jgi:hypothetical protein
MASAYHIQWAGPSQAGGPIAKTGELLPSMAAADAIDQIRRAGGLGPVDELARSA